MSDFKKGDKVRFKDFPEIGIVEKFELKKWGTTKVWPAVLVLWGGVRRRWCSPSSLTMEQ